LKQPNLKTPKAFANFSPWLGAQRQPWDLKNKTEFLSKVVYAKHQAATL
jgi:hypothetical protein